MNYHLIFINFKGMKLSVRSITALISMIVSAVVIVPLFNLSFDSSYEYTKIVFGTSFIVALISNLLSAYSHYCMLTTGKLIKFHLVVSTIAISSAVIFMMISPLMIFSKLMH